VACAADWLIDRFLDDTPWGVRYALAAAQVLLACVILTAWVFRPTFRRLSDSVLALWVEDKNPRLGHRLISTVQLNQPGAKTQGMSQELIGAVTKETEQKVAGVNFPAAADHRRLKWGATVVAPALLGSLALLVLMPQIVPLLLARQLLEDRPIPRYYSVESVTAEVWPAGEEVTLKFLVTGPDLGPELTGTTLLFPVDRENQQRRDKSLTQFIQGLLPMTRETAFDLEQESLELVFHSQAPDKGGAYYTTKAPARSGDYKYRAYVGDNRMAEAKRVRYLPRPVITNLEAWAVVAFSKRGLVNKAGVYLQDQKNGDVVAVSLPRQKARARVQVTVQKPIWEGKLEVLGSHFPDLSGQFGDSDSQAKGVKLLTDALRNHFHGAKLTAWEEDLRREKVLRTVPMQMKVSANGEVQAVADFELRPTDTAYRVTVLDEYGWMNIPQPMRTLRLIPEEAPQVALLPEIIRFYSDKGSDEDFDQTGMPAPPGQPIQLAFTCSSPYSLGRATLYWRVIKKPREDSGESAMPSEWEFYHLEESPPQPERGPFLIQYGRFEKSPLDENVEFHVLGYDDQPGKTEGGGRYNFQTKALSFTVNKQSYVGVSLEPGDKIEFKVEVFPDGKYGRTRPEQPRIDLPATRKAGESEIRSKDIVTVKEWREALERRKQQEDRLKELRKQQEKVVPVTTGRLDPAAPPPAWGDAFAVVAQSPDRATGATAGLLFEVLKPGETFGPGRWPGQETRAQQGETRTQQAADGGRLNRQGTQPLWRAAEFYRVNPFLGARAEVGWDSSRRGNNPRHYSKGGCSC